MTEIIDNPVGVFNDCNIESFFQGSCKEHILPEEGRNHIVTHIDIANYVVAYMHVLHDMMCNPFPQVGVTHVLNTAEGQQSGTVDTNEKFYK